MVKFYLIKIQNLLADNRQSDDDMQGAIGPVPMENQMDPSFAAWEKHTRGMGEKLLLKMGYKPGKGLGSSNSMSMSMLEKVLPLINLRYLITSH